VRVAIDEMGLEPDLVVSGINEGQNIGPVVDLSGTIGAARAAARRGIPALALSQGLDPTIADYQVTVPIVLDWIQDNRAAILDGSADVQVTSINVPSCKAGAVRGLAETEVDPAADPAASLGAQDCESTTPADDLEGDVALFLAGFATITTVPIEPG
jgi:5'-nucleotidase